MFLQRMFKGADLKLEAIPTYSIQKGSKADRLSADVRLSHRVQITPVPVAHNSNTYVCHGGSPLTGRATRSESGKQGFRLPEIEEMSAIVSDKYPLPSTWLDPVLPEYSP